MIRELVRRPPQLVLVLLALVLTIAPVLAVLLSPPANAATGSAGYMYKYPMVILNTGNASVTGRILYTMDAATLISDGLLLSDAQDIWESDNYLMATDLTSNTSVFTTDIITIPADGQITKTYYIGNPSATRDQSFVTQTTDTVYVANDATLQITDKLTLAANVSIPTATASDQAIIAKSGSYRLSINGSIFSFLINKSGGSEYTVNSGSFSLDTVHLVEANFDSANVGSELRIRVDSGNWSTQGAAPAPTITSNTNNVVLNQFNGYVDDTTIDSNGSVVLSLDYEPDEISSTVISDLSGSGNNASLTWGANPSDISANSSLLVATGAWPVVFGTPAPVRDVFDDVNVSDWYQEPDTAGRLATHPLAPFIDIMVLGGFTTDQAWIYLGLIFIVWITVMVAVLVRGHHVITGAACAGSIGYLCVSTVWPWWALVFTVPAILGGLISERTPSV